MFQVAFLFVLMSNRKMTTECDIRLATPHDAPAISQLIRTTVQASNAADYPPDIIARVTAHFSTATVAALINTRTVFVAVQGPRIIGTASLDDETVRTVFVAPDMQKHGVGRRMMKTVMQRAREAGQRRLSVPSSITGEGFYAGLGFVALRDEFHGEERTILMTCDLML